MPPIDATPLAVTAQSLAKKNPAQQTKPFNRWVFVLKFNICLSLAYMILRFSLFSDPTINRFTDLIYLSLAVCLPLLYLLRNTYWTKRDFGLIITRSGVFFGLFFYLVAGSFFYYVKINIWNWDTKDCSVWVLLLALTRIGTIILVDLWFRGIFFLPLSKKLPLWKALLLSNLYWDIFHTFEILEFMKTISFAHALVFIILVGILGDLIAYKTQSVIGLMAGHAIMNFLIFL